jgi:hypothetical protein
MYGFASWFICGLMLSLSCPAMLSLCCRWESCGTWTWSPGRVLWKDRESYSGGLFSQSFKLNILWPETAAGLRHQGQWLAWAAALCEYEDQGMDSEVVWGWTTPQACRPEQQAGPWPLSVWVVQACICTYLHILACISIEVHVSECLCVYLCPLWIQIFVIFCKCPH